MVGSRKAWWALVVVLIVSIGAIAGVGVWQLLSKKSAVVVVDGTEQRAAVQQVAKSTVEQIFSYQGNSIDAHNASVLALMTKAFGARFAQTAPSAAKVAGANADAKVVGTAVVSLSATTASMLVFINRTVTKPGEQPVYDGSRLTIDLSRVDGKWLVDDIVPI